jgi:hypothetical protein
MRRPSGAPFASTARSDAEPALPTSFHPAGDPAVSFSKPPLDT